MATATEKLPPSPLNRRLLATLPWAAFAVWVAGAVGIWHLGQQKDWEIGTYVLAGSAWFVVLLVGARDFVRQMFGPVFTYEMVRLGRKRITFIMRLLYVLGVMAILTLMYLAWLEEVGYFRSRGNEVPFQRLASFATEFFYVFISVQFGVVVFLTPAYVAGCIADEKERKTLEFLLATDLRNHEIIFGKVAARVANLLMFVLAGLPVVAFMQLFGGIDPDLLLAAIAATFITVIGVSSISVAFSVIFRRPRDSIAMAYLAFAVFALVSFFLPMLVMGYQTMLAGMGVTYYEVLGIGFNPVEALDYVRYVTDWLGAGNIGYIAFMMAVPMIGTGFAPAAVATALFRYVVFWAVVTAACLGYSVARLRTLALHQRYGAVQSTSTGSGAGGKGRGKGTTPVRRRARHLWVPVVILILSGVGTLAALAADVKAAYGILGMGVLLAFSFVAFQHFGGRGAIRPPIGDDPMFWKEVFAEGGVRGGCVGGVISIMVAVCLFGSLGLIVYFELLDPPRYGTWTASSAWESFTESINVWARISTGALGFVAMIAVAVRGASAVSGERDRDTWVSLLGTPLTAWEMLRAKWLGTILSLRQLYVAMLLVWGVALAVGAIDPIMMVPTILYFAVYVSAFAWIGVYCSITARTTLIASIRALMASIFLAGGFWVLVLLCCVIPLNIVARGPDMRSFEYLLFLLLGLTPPFTLGWMPLMEYNRGDMGPFSWEQRDSLGPLNPIIGFFVWFAFNWVIGLMSWHAFSKATNRTTDTLVVPKPRPTRYDPTVDDDDDQPRMKPRRKRP